MWYMRTLANSVSSFGDQHAATSLTLCCALFVAFVTICNVAGAAADALAVTRVIAVCYLFALCFRFFHGPQPLSFICFLTAFIIAQLSRQAVSMYVCIYVYTCVCTSRYEKLYLAQVCVAQTQTLVKAHLLLVNLHGAAGVALVHAEKND